MACIRLKKKIPGVPAGGVVGCRIQDLGIRGYRWWKTADFSTVQAQRTVRPPLSCTWLHCNSSRCCTHPLQVNRGNDGNEKYTLHPIQHGGRPTFHGETENGTTNKQQEKNQKQRSALHSLNRMHLDSPIQTWVTLNNQSDRQYRCPHNTCVPAYVRACVRASIHHEEILLAHVVVGLSGRVRPPPSGVTRWSTGGTKLRGSPVGGLGSTLHTQSPAASQPDGSLWATSRGMTRHAEGRLAAPPLPTCATHLVRVPRGTCKQPFGDQNPNKTGDSSFPQLPCVIIHFCAAAGLTRPKWDGGATNRSRPALIRLFPRTAHNNRLHDRGKRGCRAGRAPGASPRLVGRCTASPGR